MNSNPSFSGSQNVSVTWPAASSSVFAGSSGKPSTSWYQRSSLLEIVDLVAMLTKSTPSTSSQPTEPSICSWISRFISTAYSSGSSLVIGSTKPVTIIAQASVSERPRDIR